MARQSKSSHSDKLHQSKSTTPGSSLQFLQQNPYLWYRVRLFVYDLRHYKARDDSRDRLELVVDPSYLGAPYSSPAEVDFLKSTIVESKRSEDNGQKTLEQLIEATLDRKLNRRTKKRMESQDFRVCAAHDLAPIFEKAFRIKPKELHKDKEFVKKLSTDGLNLAMSTLSSESRSSAQTSNESL